MHFFLGHGVFIWLTASIRFQHCTSLKLLPHCQPDGPRAETLPTIPSIQRSKAPPPMARRPVGTLREHDGRGFGVVPKPLAANHPSLLRQCSPPFIMMRTSFAGCRLRSLFTCSVVLPGRRAQIHIPNALATIIAAMTFSSQRRVNASSWQPLSRLPWYASTYQCVRTISANLSALCESGSSDETWWATSFVGLPNALRTSVPFLVAEQEVQLPDCLSPHHVHVEDYA